MTGQQRADQQQPPGQQVAEEDVKRVMQLEAEGRRRNLKGPIGLGVTVIAVTLALFHLYSGLFGVLPELQQRGLHLALVLPLIFLLFPMTSRSRKDRPPLYDVALALLGAFVALYVVWDYYEISFRIGTPNQLDMVLAAVAPVLVLEATRRVIGLALPIVAMLFLLYIWAGPFLPTELGGHPGFSYRRASSLLYLSNEGIFGLPLGVSATFVALFVIFGAFLQRSGTGQFFIDLAYAGFGTVRGGPAKISVVASGFFGTISGSAIANVVGTGSFTIPLMKSLGYRPHFAGAVEAVASTGGQIMPPVMGAAAFVMSEYTNIPYIDIAIAALVPAVLYYVAVFVMIDLEAAKLGMKGLPREVLPKIRATFFRGAHLFIPPVVLLYFLVVERSTPMKAAFWSIVAVVVASWIRSHTRMGPRALLQALERGAMGVLEVAAACACAGLVVGTVFLTGLGLRLSNILVDLSGGNLLVLLILAMITSIIMGMGLPTTAVYIIMAVLVAPALVKMGVPILAAHLFVFYYGLLAVITPPVALAAYAGAGLARADPMQTGFTAWRLGLAAFILPFMFVYGPAMLLMGPPDKVALAIISGVVGAASLGISLQGYLLAHVGWIERVMLFVGALALIRTGIETDLVGYGLVIGAVAIHWAKTRGERRKAREMAAGSAEKSGG